VGAEIVARRRLAVVEHKRRLALLRRPDRWHVGAIRLAQRVVLAVARVSEWREPAGGEEEDEYRAEDRAAARDGSAGWLPYGHAAIQGSVVLSARMRFLIRPRYVAARSIRARLADRGHLHPGLRAAGALRVTVQLPPGPARIGP
jgi:hypothetical protein